MFESLIEILNTRYKRWSFVGSIVDFYHFDGQVMIKDFDVLTDDVGNPGDLRDRLLALREQFIWKGRRVEVFQGTPTEGMFQTPEERIETLKQLIVLYPNRAEKCQALIERYNAKRKLPTKSPVSTVVFTENKSCPHRGDQVDTIKCDQCSQGKGKMKPVYACAVHGRCTHRLEQRGQDRLDLPVWICVGCKDGPWPPPE